MTSRLPDFPTGNISMHTIPWVWLVSIAAPRLYGRYLYRKAANRDMDVVNPRNYVKTVSEDVTLDDKTRGQILRLEGAMNNGLENIAIFCAAVVAGNAAGLDAKFLNAMSLGYLVSRAAYNVVYAWQDTFLKFTLRPVVFFAGLGICFTLFIKAGNEFSRMASGV